MAKFINGDLPAQIILAVCFAAIAAAITLDYAASQSARIAEIEFYDGRIVRARMASASACLEFTRAIAADVAAANCYTETE